ncbi:methyltransferase family protein [Allosphingosinicella indica]|uniref:Protein-S-isoprenylcysteine O-methyltransferase Ste14 n=1 Tax=Allosphingosinicella indica TaxID=941907 RepID=A0A1X7G0T9_9SPHN|nr:isoprenylcysteine carboxylmethyltransferase family protein [Allosphingosinicella indica]SMF61607.1 Protein-S-isoprenylcysteine O-methyltransferase Ste14 [Allosphingosinicella indica]
MAGGGRQWRPPPDAWAALAIAAALLLEWLWPLGLLPPPGVAVSGVGIVILLAGLALEMASARALIFAGTTTKAGAEPQALVTTGPFAKSRNPFYIGLLLVMAGLFVATGLDWGVLALPLLWLALDLRVIPFEEQRLAAAFGDEYRSYAARVRRWL